jgi:quercetin dioxygenase-like cupin family protein
MTAKGEILNPGEGRPMLDGRAQIKLGSGQADFSVFQQRTDVDPAGVPPHRHRSYDEAFFVLEGEMTFDVGERQSSRAGPGTFVFVPRGVPHRFANPGPTTARMLVIGSSGIQALVEEVAPLLAASPPDLQAVNEALSRHDSEIIAPSTDQASSRDN